MTDWTTDVLAVSVAITFALVLAAMALTFWRMVRGPSLPDRVVALDLLAILMVTFTAVVSVAADEPAFLDVGIALALVAFLGTVAFARYAERRAAARHAEESAALSAAPPSEPEARP